MPYENKRVLSIAVPPGTERPYAVSTGEIPVRRGTETTHARRDEILVLVRGGSIAEQQVSPAMAASPTPAALESSPTAPPALRGNARARQQRTPTREVRDAPETGPRLAPRNGVEIVDVVDQDGIAHYSMRDLRNDQLTRNVTAATARSLWAQAIREYEKGPPTDDRIQWHDNLGFWKSTRISNGERRYHLALRTDDGRTRIFFGISEDGLDSAWRAVIPALSGSHSESSEAPIPR